jgi:hypothetical protein
MFATYRDRLFSNELLGLHIRQHAVGRTNRPRS